MRVSPLPNIRLARCWPIGALHHRHHTAAAVTGSLWRQPGSARFGHIARWPCRLRICYRSALTDGSPGSAGSRSSLANRATARWAPLPASPPYQGAGRLDSAPPGLATGWPAREINHTEGARVSLGLALCCTYATGSPWRGHFVAGSSGFWAGGGFTIGHFTAGGGVRAGQWVIGIGVVRADGVDWALYFPHHIRCVPVGARQHNNADVDHPGVA